MTTPHNETPPGPRNDPNADWASIQGTFPDDLHGNTRGKRYQFKSDGRCPECLVEACERQQGGGLGAGFARKVLLSGLAFDRPAYLVRGDRLSRTLDTWCPLEWTVELRVRGL